MSGPRRAHIARRSAHRSAAPSGSPSPPPPPTTNPPPVVDVDACEPPEWTLSSSSPAVAAAARASANLVSALDDAFRVIGPGVGARVTASSHAPPGPSRDADGNAGSEPGPAAIAGPSASRIKSQRRLIRRCPGGAPPPPATSPPGYPGDESTSFPPKPNPIPTHGGRPWVDRGVPASPVACEDPPVLYAEKSPPSCDVDAYAAADGASSSPRARPRGGSRVGAVDAHPPPPAPDASPYAPPPPDIPKSSYAA